MFRAAPGRTVRRIGIERVIDRLALVARFTAHQPMAELGERSFRIEIGQIGETQVALALAAARELLDQRVSCVGIAAEVAPVDLAR